MDDEYTEQAVVFLRRFGLHLSLEKHDNPGPPSWSLQEEGGHGIKYHHGIKYRVVIRRTRGPTLGFDFWGSIHDRETGEAPSDYDILACISSDASGPTDPDEIYREYGPMPPSQAKRIADFAYELQHFFTEEELEELQEIQ